MKFSLALTYDEGFQVQDRSFDVTCSSTVSEWLRSPYSPSFAPWATHVNVRVSRVITLKATVRSRCG